MQPAEHNLFLKNKVEIQLLQIVSVRLRSNLRFRLYKRVLRLTFL